MTALVSDGLSSRPHLTVVQSPNTGAELVAGKGVVRVSISRLTTQAIFEREQTAFGDNGASQQSRRILPLQFMANIEFLLRPKDNTAEGLFNGRTLLLEDMSLVGHNLGEAAVRNGKAFKTAGPDQGFQVLTFILDNGVVTDELVNGLLKGDLFYQGTVEIWPPGVSKEEGTIRALDFMMAPLPININADKASLQAGETANIRIPSITGQRLVTVAGNVREALRLAVVVLSDLPPAQRGKITSGEPGAEVGFQIVQAGEPETVILYQAPTGDIGATRLEYVAVHLATPDKKSGLFLGSTAIRLEPQT